MWHVVGPVGLCPQNDFDVAQGLLVARLRERHGKKLIQAREVLALVIASMLGHPPSKSVHGKVGHELRENELALVHVDPSRQRAKGRTSNARPSNRDQSKTPN